MDYDDLMVINDPPEGGGDSRTSRTRDDALHADIDARLADAWLGFWEVSEWDPARASAFLRWSYAQGYADSLTEPRRGKLFRDHGLPAPKRQRQEDVENR
jgi:hypothetical protein